MASDKNKNEIINSLHSIRPETSPPTEYIDWNTRSAATIIKLNTNICDFDFDEISHINIKIRDRISYPCVIQENDVDNIIKLASIQHEDVKLDIKEIVKYNPTAYARHYDAYRKKYNATNSEYLCKDSVNSQQELSKLLTAKKEMAEEAEKKIAAITEKYTHMGFRFCNAKQFLTKIWSNLFDYPAIEELNFWDTIKSVEIESEQTSLIFWKVSPIHILYIMQTEVYADMYARLHNAIVPHISADTIKSSCIIHYIIFRGKAIFDYVMESPDFSLFMLEDGILNIPKSLIAKLSTSVYRIDAPQ